jgi:predicted nucleotidyltransferase
LTVEEKVCGAAKKRRMMEEFHMEDPDSRLALLERRLGANWSHIRAGRDRARAKRAELRSALTGFDSEDTSIVVFGSLARDEFTPGSDIDWTLLIDGSADPKHLELAHRIEEVIGKAAAKPSGREGTFGSMAFSHDLIHQIGGEDDTNRNTTRRILLLLESDVVGRPEAYDRVLKNVLQRYLMEDRGFSHGSARYHVPRFLLNDFSRYWRTMAVDFAYKHRTRFGEGSAIRNFKLRMSRKLIYVTGLLTCFGCHLGFGEGLGAAVCSKPSGSPECIECLRRFLRRTPLEILASSLTYLDHLDGTAIELFTAYDEFLGMLTDREARAHLESLPPDPDQSDETFQKARRVSHSFRDGLLELLFDDKSELSQLTKTYGVF